MDEVQKSQVRLVHWIDHNVEHLKGYREVLASLERNNLHAVAAKIGEGIKLIEAANDKFQIALDDLSTLIGPSESTVDTAKTHSHVHDPNHDHSHDHSEGHNHHHHRHDEE